MINSACEASGVLRQVKCFASERQQQVSVQCESWYWLRSSPELAMGVISAAPQLRRKRE
jgi:hypothetical protein